MTRVLVAVDESPSSVAAARAAHALFGDAAEYLAVNVSTTTVPWVGSDVLWGGSFALQPGWTGPGWPAAPEEVGAAGIDASQGARATAGDAMRDAGVEGARPLGEVGDPAHAVLVAAREHAADVIVVGSHSRSWWDRLVRPSVTKELLKEADVPVLVVPTDDGG